MSWIVALAHWTQYDFAERARRTQKLQFITIGYSHYVELARWCLQLTEVPLEEHRCAPAQHVLPTLACRISRGNRQKHLPASTRMKRLQREGDKRRDQDSGATSVPVCVLPTGEVITDSWSIAAHSGLAAPSDDMLKLLDEELGPLCRQYTYCFVLNPANANVWNALATHKQGWFWRFIWWAGLGKKVSSMMSGIFRSSDAALMAQCREKLVHVFDTLAEILAKSKGPFLTGATITTADVAVAALAAPLVSPELFAEGEYFKYFTLLEQQDPAFAAEVAFFRSKPIGQFVLLMYAQHRVSSRSVESVSSPMSR